MNLAYLAERCTAYSLIFKDLWHADKYEKIERSLYRITDKF